MKRPETLEELTKLMAEAAQMIGNDVFRMITQFGAKIDAETGIQNLGNNIGVNAAGFVLDQLLVEFAARGSDRPREELFREISARHQKVVQEILSEYSKSKFSIMIDLSKKEGA